MNILEIKGRLCYICSIKRSLIHRLVTDHNQSVLGFILWGDEIFGRHALSSRGWGLQDKRSIEPTGIAVQCKLDRNKADQG